MSKFSRDTDVLVGDKQLKIEEILKSIIYLPAEQVLEFFNDIGLTVPRELRIYVLRENLREKVAQTRKTRLTLADELNYRLSWFTEFTETQLENLLVFFDDKEIVKKYLEDLWTDLFGYMVEKEVPDFDLDRLYQKGLSYVKEHPLELPDIGQYNLTISKIFYDSFGRIDGVSPNKIRNVLYKSSTLGEIRSLGEKYDVKIPRRLKKNQLADIIVNELKDNGDYTEDLEKQVRSMSVIIMQRFAIDHDIKASTELKKEEVIEFILKNATETKETYFIPNSREVYEKEIDEITEDDTAEQVEEETFDKVDEAPKEETPVEEQIKEEETLEIVEENPTIEEEVSEVETKVEAVVEEKPEIVREVQTQVQYVAPSINLDALVDEVKKLREVVQNFETKSVEQPAVVESPVMVHEVVNEKVEEKSHEDLLKVEMINTAEYYGSAKAYQQTVKNEEAEAREAFIEKQKASKVKEPKDVPAELMFMGKFFKGAGKKLWVALKFLFKWLILIAIFAAIVLVLYTILVESATITFLDSITNWLNGVVSIEGQGLIDWIAGQLRLLGIIQ